MTKSDFLKHECRHCAGHIEYPAEAGGQTIACPHCGQPVELPPPPVTASGKPARPLVWGIIVIGVAAAALAGALVFLKKPPVVSEPVSVPEKSVAPAPPAVKPPDETTTNGFAVSMPKLEKTPGSSLVYVAGTVRNLTDKQRFGVKAEFSLFDTNGVSTGVASDYAATLDPQGVWKFKALVMGSKAARAKLNSVREDQ
jgi:hypothetical protein